MPPEADMPPWPDLIAEMGKLREQVSQIDDDAFPFTIPHLAATPDQIVAAEQRLGHSLDPQHRSFLSYGNGCPDFYLGSSLLSTEDLGHGAKWKKAHEILDVLYEGVDDPNVLPPRAHIYPFTVSEDTASVFVLWLGSDLYEGGHTVLWLPWSDTDPIPNFFEFYRMVYREYESELEADHS